jgi:hypothetical protein
MLQNKYGGLHCKRAKYQLGLVLRPYGRIATIDKSNHNEWELENFRLFGDTQMGRL